jgi:hypothetical protein
MNQQQQTPVATAGLRGFGEAPKLRPIAQPQNKQSLRRWTMQQLVPKNLLLLPKLKKHNARGLIVARGL